MQFTDYYKLLGVAPGATEEEIRTSYRKLSKKFHPDLNEGDQFFSERFKDIQSAYEVLSDRRQRTRYQQRYQSFYQSAAVDMPQRKKFDSKLFLLLVPLVLIGAAVFYSSGNSANAPDLKKSEAKEGYQIMENVDSLISAQNKSILPMGNFRIILHRYHNYDTAYKSFIQLQSYGYKVMFLNRGPDKYEIAMPFARPLSDTTIVRDSIDGVFDTRTFVSY